MQKRVGFGKRYGWLLLALLTAVSLRLYHLTSVPPGLTHDEADHGLTAWRILYAGARDIYFAIGYGREPLYDYLTAGLMALIGPTYLAGRLVAAFASLLALAALYAWVALAFDRRVALLTLAGTAVAFWPLMTARQMLRSGLLPLLFTLAVLLFWRGLRQLESREWRLEIDVQSLIANLQSPILKFFAAGIFLGLAFYVYLPARVLWALFPLLLLYLALAERPLLRRAWRGTLIMLATAAVVAAPLFLYLARNPQLEARVTELSTPLTAAAQGNFQPLLQNTLASLRLFTFSGDTAWRYNIPARPFLDPLWGALFYAGLLLALYAIIHKQGSKGADEQGGNCLSPAPLLPCSSASPSRSPAFFALGWLLLGISPVFVTGPELATTQAIGAQPVLFLFPALALARLRDWGLASGNWRGRIALTARRQSLIALFLFGGTAVFTARAYFITWANAPEVRVQYETTMVTALRYLAARPAAGVAISTITPAPEHSPAVARMLLPAADEIRWFDGRSSLLLPPQTQTIALVPGFATRPEGVRRYWQTAVLSDTLPMRPTDLDRPIHIYQIDTSDAFIHWQSAFTPPPAPTYLGDALQFLGYDLQTPALRPGEMLRLATLWQVQRPLPQAQLFTHLWTGSGAPIAQQDLLGAPAANWRAGDLLIQLHEFVVPETAVATTYQLIIGGYDPISGARFPIWQGNQPAGEAILLQPITLEP